MMNPEMTHMVKIANIMARLLVGLIDNPTGIARLDSRP